MVRPAIEETRILLFLALTTLLIIAFCGTTCFSATTAIADTTQLKTYTDPGGFFTLQYPTDWTTEYKQPVTKFDKPSVVFKAYRLMSMFTGNSIDSIVTIYVQPSNVNTPEEFKDSVSSLGSYMANHNPAFTIMGEGFGSYYIAGYDT